MKKLLILTLIFMTNAAFGHPNHRKETPETKPGKYCVITYKETYRKNEKKTVVKKVCYTNIPTKPLTKKERRDLKSK